MRIYTSLFVLVRCAKRFCLPALRPITLVKRAFNQPLLVHQHRARLTVACIRPRRDQGDDGSSRARPGCGDTRTGSCGDSRTPLVDLPERSEGASGGGCCGVHVGHVSPDWRRRCSQLLQRVRARFILSYLAVFEPSLETYTTYTAKYSCSCNRASCGSWAHKRKQHSGRGSPCSCPVKKK
jgi:hypothetical protein